MLWLGVAAHEAGFDTLFMYSWRDREKVMDLLENLCGNRVNYSINVLGGVKEDVDDAIRDDILKGVDYLEDRTHLYLKLVTTERTLVGRTRGIGFMTKQLAAQLGTVGPTARASGLERDIRVEAPYGAYVDLPVKIVVETAGDLEARFVVRIKELFESYRLIRLVLEKLPEGDLTTKMPRRIPEGETISRVEAPRGELFYFIKSNGTDIPDRVKVRTPSINNFASVIATAVGHKLADIPMILSGIDPCFSCNDRMVTIKGDEIASGWNYEDLRKYGIEYYL
jgi:NADH-quinone oxidoreductase subunit D